MSDIDATKDPADWTTGDEPATGPQLSYLSTLAREAGEDVPENITKAEASTLIDRLQGRSERLDGVDDAGAAKRSRGDHDHVQGDQG